MASRYREDKAIQAVACPDCGAPRGILCNRKKEHNVKGRLFICKGRLVAWQMIRDGEIQDAATATR
jgi:uncharacterized protein YbaR (Trm112 family)